MLEATHAPASTDSRRILRKTCVSRLSSGWFQLREIQVGAYLFVPIHNEGDAGEASPSLCMGISMDACSLRRMRTMWSQNMFKIIAVALAMWYCRMESSLGCTSAVSLCCSSELATLRHSRSTHSCCKWDPCASLSCSTVPGCTGVQTITTVTPSINPDALQTLEREGSPLTLSTLG